MSAHRSSANNRIIELTIPTRHESKRFIDPFTRQPDETSTHGHEDGHLGDAIVDQPEEDGIDGVREEQRAGSAVMQSAANADEQASPYTPTDCNELDLSVAQSSVKLVSVLGDDALGDVLGPVVGRHIVVYFVDAGVALLALGENAHPGSRKRKRDLGEESWEKRSWRRKQRALPMRGTYCTYLNATVVGSTSWQ